MTHSRGHRLVRLELPLDVTDEIRKEKNAHLVPIQGMQMAYMYLLAIGNGHLWIAAINPSFD